MTRQCCHKLLVKEKCFHSQRLILVKAIFGIKTDLDLNVGDRCEIKFLEKKKGLSELIRTQRQLQFCNPLHRLSFWIIPLLFTCTDISNWARCCRSDSGLGRLSHGNSWLYELSAALGSTILSRVARRWNFTDFHDCGWRMVSQTWVPFIKLPCRILN